jgi:Domain of unknown function (DUF4145)
MVEKNFIVLDCPFCRIRVRAEVAAALEHGGGEDEPPAISVALARCPSCGHPLVGYEQDCGYEHSFGSMRQVWSDPMRVWPRPKVNLSGSIPEKIAASLNEAQTCLAAGAYTASVAMTGRALEAIGRHFHTKGKADRLMLAEGLDELHNSQIIDKRLYEWGKELKENRNLAAHASDQAFDRDDAEDLFNFATAICEYVFVLSEKFADFKKRQADKKKPKEAGGAEA